MEHYILMSDVIESRQKDQTLLMNNFRSCTAFINEKYGHSILSPLTITLGDEFQGVIKDLPSSIKIILELEEFIIKNNFPMKLRYIIHYGQIETKINPDIAYQMLGEGLSHSRNLINKMKEKDTRFYVDIKNAVQKSILNNCFTIYQNIVDKWKIDKDYKLISSLIEHSDYKIVAEILNKDRSLIWKREKNLNMSSFYATKEIINAVITI